MSDTSAFVDDRIARLERRLDRERRARLEAENLLEGKSRALFQANQQLSRLAADLELRVEERTHELGAARERALQLAECDQLTGLANRMCFARHLDDAITRSRNSGRGFMLLLVDLDRFKAINDTLGHGAGDLLLQEVAKHLKAAVRPGDLVARIGGDEFVVICEICPSPAAIGAVAERIIANMRRPVNYGGRVVTTACSIGIASFPDHASNALDLQRCADLALYRSKAAGRAIHTIFDGAMLHEAQERLALSRELHHAVGNGLIEPWFQPIVDAATKRVTSVEVLARWPHPERGLLAPGSFLGLVEDCGLMGEMFDGLLVAACACAIRWIDAGRFSHLAINVSPSQFKSGTLADNVLERLAELDFPPACLTMEITEDALLHDLPSVCRQIDRLAARGVRIALDDFGAGYSNIAYLRQLPIHSLKLDRALTAEVTKDAKAKAVLRGVVEIAHALNLDVVAEGVENADDAACLTQLGCRYLQGYLFGRPMPAALWAAMPKAVNRPDVT